MARSVLRALVNGTRQLLTAQLVVSIITVALAGWTLAVTNNVLRERDRLRDRVIQLEQAMASSGIVVPATPVLVDQAVGPSVANAYPGEIGLAANGALRSQSAIEVRLESSASAQTRAPAPSRDPGANFSRVLTGLFAPAPPLRITVLHVRSQADAETARAIAADFIRAAHVRVIIDVMAPRDPRETGYAYFDGRQSAGAAALVALFTNAARQHEIAPWSAQLRGTALPAQGEFGADRVDLVLPALPAPPPPPVVTQEPAQSTAPPPAPN